MKPRSRRKQPKNSAWGAIVADEADAFFANNPDDLATGMLDFVDVRRGLKNWNTLPFPISASTVPVDHGLGYRGRAFKTFTHVSFPWISERISAVRNATEP